MPRPDTFATPINFALQSTFTLWPQLPRSLLHGLSLNARLHWSPHEPQLLSVSFTCEPRPALRGRDGRATACLEAVVRRLSSRRR
jgi:hypothetical protein